jgi:flagellar assembly protein FliH
MTAAASKAGGSTPLAGGTAKQARQGPSADRPDLWSTVQPHVLIVEDDPGVRDLLQQLLQRDKYRITAVGDGQSAFDVFSRESVQLLLTDYSLPDTDGLAIIERTLRESPQTSAVIITGHASVDLAVKAMKAGASDFLTKPFVATLVSMTVKRVLELQRLRRENAVMKSSLLKAGQVRVQAVQLSDIAPRTGTDEGMAPGGFSQGVEEGERRAAARDRARQEREHALLSAVITQLEGAVAAVRATAQDQVTALAFSIASKIVREEAGSQQERILSQVQTALSHVQGSPLVRIRVHPQDVATLEQAKGSLGRTVEPPATIRIDGDASITPGGCLVETASRLVDATLEAQLVRLGEVLKKRGASATS